MNFSKRALSLTALALIMLGIATVFFLIDKLFAILLFALSLIVLGGILLAIAFEEK